jgi:hypothetical protein
MAGSVNQNFRFDLGARKMFFVPAPKIVLQQNRPNSAVTVIGPRRQLSGDKLASEVIVDDVEDTYRPAVRQRRIVAGCCSKVF